MRITLSTPFRHERCWPAWQRAIEKLNGEKLWERIDQLVVYEDAMVALQSASTQMNEALNKLDESFLKSGALSQFFSADTES